MSDQRDARGSVTVLMSAVLVLGALGCLAIGQGVTLVSKRAHASAVADAAALAAATALSNGSGENAAAKAAALVVRRNGSRIEHCECVGLDATVTVSVATNVLGVSVVYARARAEVDFNSA